MLTSADVRGITSRRREIAPRSQLLYLLALDDVREGKPFPSIATLAGRIGCSERAVYSRLAELVDCGELVLLGRGEWWPACVDGPPRERVYSVPVKGGERHGRDRLGAGRVLRS
jgi:hypothetical protein